MIYELGPFRLDTEARVLTHDGAATALGARGVAVLAALVSRAGEYVDKSVIMDAAWPSVVVEEDNLTVQVSAIRRVLARVPGGKEWIETLTRRGYRFVGPVGRRPEQSHAVAAPANEPPSIAVLPFVNRSHGAEGGIEAQVAATPANLPAERDSFVGRDAELHRLAQLWVGGVRLITLTGTGGSGKTRLARRYALKSLQAWPGGVYFCDLSEARSQDGICFAVASALGVQLTDQDPVALLGHAIAGHGRCLLILDNFEQVSALAPTTVGRWLQRAALASFMVTSRERLHIAGETFFPLEPLPLDSDAIELFRVRARAQRPEFWLDVDGAAAVKRIVELVDGLPLAIELAAARVRVLSLSQIAERMSDRFRVLVGTSGATARQTTMKAAIDWSWDLLTPWEQRALATCSLFEGGFTLRATEAVLDLSECADAPPVMDVIESLIDKSLLRVWMPVMGIRPDLAEPYFGMYVSIHEYAKEKLESCGSAARRVAEERHGRYFASLGSEQSLELFTGNEEIERGRTRTLALDNLVAAFRRAVGRGDVETMASTYRAAWEVLEVRGPMAVGIELGSRLPELGANDGDLLVAGHLARARALWRTGQTAVATELLEAVVALTSQNGNRRREGVARTLLGNILHRTGKIAEARTQFDRALLLHREVENRRGEAQVLSNLGNIAVDQGRFDESKAQYVAALDVYRTIGDTGARAPTLGNLANVCVYLRDYDEAQRLYGEALEIARRLGDRRSEGNLLGNMANLADLTGRPQEALELTEAALLIHRQVGSRRFESTVLGNLGELYLARGQLEEAVRHLKASLEVAVEVGDPLLEGIMLGHLGRVYERQQRLDQARVSLESSVEILRSIASRRFEGIALGALGSVLARLGMLDEARRTFASGDELLQQTNDPVELGKLLCAHARAELDAGNRKLTKSLVGRAEALADRLKLHECSVLTGEIAALRERI
jgi:predicted ATPase/DNA-binding winged helix-turn-helix (wHTH) protein/Flp pilus assembly protein TadD